MATALISVLTQKPVNKYVAMTGEITLRGRVLPVGGLKEKALGALRAGIRTVIIPEKNNKELSEIPKNIKRKLKFVPVSNIDQVFDIAFRRESKRKKIDRKQNEKKG
jgi:ATP-dependent Lon protease